MNPSIEKPQLVDSHCHLNQIDLKDFNFDLDVVMQQARDEGVVHFLCVCIGLNDVPILEQIIQRYPDVSMSIGVHPNEPFDQVVTQEQLVTLGRHSRCIAIGETGLDYYRVTENSLLEQQRNRFRDHIQAAKILGKPLIIHTREAAEDTLRIMIDEHAAEVGGVLHCFSENWDIATRALALNFYISFSGILTFKNAIALQEVARRVPLDRILIETDSPYLAPTPLRGRQNHPALVKHVAKMLSELRNVSYETIAAVTTENFYRCFNG